LLLTTSPFSNALLPKRSSTSRPEAVSFESHLQAQLAALAARGE
jgi:hypothetical protein